MVRQVVPIEERDYADVLHQVTQAAGEAWTNSCLPGHPVAWRFYSRPDIEIPSYGWKLHVSCATWDVVQMLTQIAPILLESQSPFKVPASLQAVSSLNFGDGGETQIGKVVTIYAIDEEEFLHLGLAVADGWRNIDGPWIVSDLAVRENRRVFARWGAFRGGIHVNRCGRVRFVVDCGDGRILEDQRRLDGKQSAWAPPSAMPLCTADRTPVLRKKETIIQGRRYITLHTYPSRPGTAVSLVLDMDSLDTAILKRVRRGALSDSYGFDAMDRVRNEFNRLRELQCLGMADLPNAVAISDESHEILNMVQTHLEAPTIAQLDRVARISCLPLLAQAIADLHRAGYVHRDIKATNAVALPDRVILIDFELASRVDSQDCLVGGTPGYVGPEGSTPSASQSSDSFALGATVFQTLTGINPATVPLAHRAGRMTGILARQGWHGVANLVSCLTRDEPSLRATPSDTCGNGFLAPCWSDLSIDLSRGMDSRTLSLRRKKRWLQCALEVGQQASAFECSQTIGTTWSFLEEHGVSYGDSLYSGAAGAALALRTLGSCLGYSRFQEHAYRAGLWMASQPPQVEAHGLFTGNAGVALTLAILGKTQNDSDLLEAAYQRFVAADAADYDDPDLFSGSAGIIWGAVIIANILEESWPLELVARRATTLMAQVESEGGVPCWRSSEAFDSTRKPYFGVAHGSAGVALALGIWGRRTGHQGSLALALETFRSLCSSLNEGLDLVEGPQRSLVPMTMWCHGSAGLLWALLRAVDAIPSVEGLLPPLAEHFLSESSLPSSTDMCHGIGGLLDVAHSLRRRGIGGGRAEAYVACLADVLILLATRTGQSRVWPLIGTDAASPGLMQGFLGPASTLAIVASNKMDGLLSDDWLMIR